MHHYLNVIWPNIKVFLFESNSKSIGYHLLAFLNHFFHHKQ
jgi:hypothetical protein